LKKKSKLRHIPNILSLLRIPFSIALPFLAYFLKSPVPFLISYAIAGGADVLDGFLARRFHWESKLGAKMDSIGDVIFLVFAILAAILTLDFTFKWYVFAALGVLSVIRIANALFTRVKFKQWGFIHLRSARWSVVPLYILFPICIYQQKVYNPFVALCLVLSILACVEEFWILTIMDRDEYTMDMKSIYHMKKLKKQKAAPAMDEEREMSLV